MRLGEGCDQGFLGRTGLGAAVAVVALLADIVHKLLAKGFTLGGYHHGTANGAGACVKADLLAGAVVEGRARCQSLANRLICNGKALGEAAPGNGHGDVAADNAAVAALGVDGGVQDQIGGVFGSDGQLDRIPAFGAHIHGTGGAACPDAPFVGGVGVVVFFHAVDVQLYAVMDDAAAAAHQIGEEAAVYIGGNMAIYMAAAAAVEAGKELAAVDVGQRAADLVGVAGVPVPTVDTGIYGTFEITAVDGALQHHFIGGEGSIGDLVTHIGLAQEGPAAAQGDTGTQEPGALLHTLTAQDVHDLVNGVADGAVTKVDAAAGGAHINGACFKAVGQSAVDIAGVHAQVDAVGGVLGCTVGGIQVAAGHVVGQIAVDPAGGAGAHINAGIHCVVVDLVNVGTADVVSHIAVDGYIVVACHVDAIFQRIGGNSSNFAAGHVVGQGAVQGHSAAQTVPLTAGVEAPAEGVGHIAVDGHIVAGAHIDGVADLAAVKNGGQVAVEGAGLFCSAGGGGVVVGHIAPDLHGGAAHFQNTVHTVYILQGSTLANYQLAVVVGQIVEGAVGGPHAVSGNAGPINIGVVAV